MSIELSDIPTPVACLEIAKFLPAKDARSFALSSKKYLPVLSDIKIWSKLAEQDFGHSTLEFYGKLKVCQHDLRGNSCTGLLSPYKLYKEIEEDNKWPKTCQWQFTRGDHKGEFCKAPTMRRSNFCRFCTKKKGILRHEYPNVAQIRSQIITKSQGETDVKFPPL